MLKRTFSLLLVFALLMSVSLTALAQDGEPVLEPA
jgi:hypothetical protein